MCFNFKVRKQINRDKIYSQNYSISRAFKTLLIYLANESIIPSFTYYNLYRSFKYTKSQLKLYSTKSIKTSQEISQYIKSSRSFSLLILFPSPIILHISATEKSLKDTDSLQHCPVTRYRQPWKFQRPRLSTQQSYPLTRAVSLITFSNHPRPLP